eukprot:11158534-Lingulodinium_polyedra.AAC.1
MGSPRRAGEPAYTPLARCAGSLLQWCPAVTHAWRLCQRGRRALQEALQEPSAADALLTRSLRQAS